MHLFDHHDEPPSPIASSSRTGGGVDVRVRGELDFIAAEQLLHHVRDLAEPVASTGREPIHLYLDGVTTVRPAAVRLLLAFATELAGEGVDLTMVDPNGVLVIDDSPTTP
jgi:glutaminase